MTNEVPKASDLRLNAFLAKSGIASRRGAEAYILEGRIKLNGIIVKELGTRVREGDKVELDGKPVSREKAYRYFALNKPPGYLCSSSDPQNRPLAINLLGEKAERLYNVGRLDFLSSGLIFFTNDGEFASIVGHPSTAPEKEYFIEADKELDPSILERFTRGVMIEGIRYMAVHAEVVSDRSAKIVLVEGKNKEIRRVLAAFGIRPRVLRRVRIGRVDLGGLPEGRYRDLTEAEIHSLTHG